MHFKDEDKALEILTYALDHGLYYWDTAHDYSQNGIVSEVRLGKILKYRRKEIFLATKVSARGSIEAPACTITGNKISGIEPRNINVACRLGLGMARDLAGRYCLAIVSSCLRTRSSGHSAKNSRRVSLMTTVKIPACPVLRIAPPARAPRHDPR